MRFEEIGLDGKIVPFQIGSGLWHCAHYSIAFALCGILGGLCAIEGVRPVSDLYVSSVFLVSTEHKASLHFASIGTQSKPTTMTL